MEWYTKKMQDVRSGGRSVTVHYLADGDTVLASVWPVPFAGGYDVSNVRDGCSIGFYKTIGFAKAAATDHMQDAQAA